MKANKQLVTIQNLLTENHNIQNHVLSFLSVGEKIEILKSKINDEKFIKLQNRIISSLKDKELKNEDNEDKAVADLGRILATTKDDQIFQESAMTACLYPAEKHFSIFIKLDNYRQKLLLLYTNSRRKEELETLVFLNDASESSADHILAFQQFHTKIIAIQELSRDKQQGNLSEENNFHMAIAYQLFSILIELCAYETKNTRSLKDVAEHFIKVADDYLNPQTRNSVTTTAYIEKSTQSLTDKISENKALQKGNIKNPEKWEVVVKGFFTFLTLAILCGILSTFFWLALPAAIFATVLFGTGLSPIYLVSAVIASNYRIEEKCHYKQPFEFSKNPFRFWPAKKEAALGKTPQNEIKSELSTDKVPESIHL